MSAIKFSRRVCLGCNRPLDRFQAVPGEQVCPDCPAGERTEIMVAMDAAEYDRLRRDSERYQWLKKQGFDWRDSEAGGGGWYYGIVHDVDGLLDAAMEAK